MKRIFVSNCEGPISLNDIAFDLTTHFVPEGDRVHKILTAYDYVRACFSKKADYMIGNTSKLVLPFLLAFDANNKNVEEFAAEKLVLLKNSKETLNYANKTGHAFIVSTSYEHHIRAICREIGFPLENVYSPNVNLDKFALTTKEKAKLKSIAWEIGGMPPISIPKGALSMQELSSKDQETIKRLDKIFWKEITKTQCKQAYSDVNVASKTEKAKTIQKISNDLAIPLKEIMYVGSDATDTEAMKLVRTKGGLVISFNGSKTAVKNADIAVISEYSTPISVLADLFLRLGKAEASKIAGNFDKDFLWMSSADSTMLNQLFELYPNAWPKVNVISQWNMETIVNQSNQFRKTVQGIPAAKNSQP